LKPPGNSEADLLAKGGGSYLENLKFGDDAPVWDINMKGLKSDFKKPAKGGDLGWHILPSDSS
jgi:hypothetical protein